MKEKILKEINKQIRYVTGLKKPPETFKEYLQMFYIPPMAENIILPRLDVLYSLKAKINKLK